MLRTIAAIVLGYLVFGVPAVLLFQLSGVDPHVHPTTAFLVFGIAYGVVFAFGAGYVTAWIARGDVLWPVLTVASIIAVIAAGSLAAHPGAGDIWSQLAALFLMTPAAVLGGALRLRGRR